MQVISLNESEIVSGGISKHTVAAGSRLLGRALLGGIAIGSGIGAVLAVTMIAFDVYQILD